MTLVLRDGTRIDSDAPIGLAEAMREAVVVAGRIIWPDGTSGRQGYVAITKTEKRGSERRYLTSLTAFGLTATPIDSPRDDMACWLVTPYVRT